MGLNPWNWCETDMWDVSQVNWKWGTSSNSVTFAFDTPWFETHRVPQLCCGREFVWVKHHLTWPYTYTSNGLSQWLPTHRIYHLPAVTANPSSGAFFNGVDWHGMVQGANCFGCCWSPQGSLLDVLWSRDYLRKVRFTVDLIFFEWFWFSIYYIYSIYIYWDLL